MKKINSFGLIAFKTTAAVKEVVQRIEDWGSLHDIPVNLHPVLVKIIGKPLTLSETDFINSSDAVISLGGDGTFLSAAHLCRFSEKPLIGVNLGGLGYLTDISTDSLEHDLMKIREGHYTTISRMVLDVKLVRSTSVIHEFHALNDIYISRIHQPRLTSLSAWSGEDFIADFHADGIIVATPNGSTAYSLSAGGPIVEPTVQAFLLTPICPHSLTVRPLILPSCKPIRLVVNDNNPELLLSVDGLESVPLDEGDQIVISYGGISGNCIQLAERSYFSLLRTKLGWGRGLKQRSNQS